MIKVRIIVGEFEAFQEHLSLWSLIYLQTDEFFFPSEVWTDATSSILVMWAENVSSILLGSSKSVELMFMDGDYTVVMEAISHVEGRMQFLGPNGQMGVLCDIDLVYFARQVLSACAKLSHHYQAFQNSHQLQELLNAADSLRKAIAKY